MAMGTTMQERAEIARQGRQVKLEQDRWSRFEDYRKGKFCGCDIQRGYTFQDLCIRNLRGRGGERANCQDPFFVCSVLSYALELTQRGGKL